jgi:hypothetical protein
VDFDHNPNDGFRWLGCCCGTGVSGLGLLLLGGCRFVVGLVVSQQQQQQQQKPNNLSLCLINPQITNQPTLTQRKMLHKSQTSQDFEL